MTTPLYIRGGVEQELPEIVSFYEDVAKQMTNAYNDLYKTLIDIKEKLNTTEKTLEIINNEKEKLLKQNECLAKEIENEPINLGSTHILHNILCNKAEAYKVLKENEYRELKKNSNVETTGTNKEKVDNILEQETQLKDRHSQIEDLLNQWKNKFENPVTNVTLNVTPVPKRMMQDDVKKNRVFKSWQDELKYYVNEKHKETVRISKDESKKANNEQEQNEEYCNVTFIKQEKEDSSTKLPKTDLFSNCSKKEETEKSDVLKKPEEKKINEEKEECEQVFSKTHSLCSNRMNSNNKIGPMKIYDELQFSDNSINSTEKCVEKLSEENKILNIILNKKKKVYAQVYENHARGSSYEVFQNLQKMENVQNLKNIQNNRIGDATGDVDTKLLQYLQKNKINEVKPNYSRTPFIPFAIRSPNTFNNNFAIHSTEHNIEKEGKKCNIHYAEQRKHMNESQNKDELDLTDENQSRNCISLNDFDTRFNSITNNVDINKSINTKIYNNFNDVGINNEEHKKHSEFVFPQSELLHIDNNNCDLYNHSEGAYRKETMFFPSYNIHNKTNEHNKSNLRDLNRIRVPNYLTPYETNMHLENSMSMNLSNNNYPKSMEPLNYYRGWYDPMKTLRTINENNCKSSNNKTNFENSNHFNYLNSFHNNSNFHHPYNSNGFTNRMQDWKNHTTYEFTNAGDAIFYGSASSFVPSNSNFNGNNGMMKNSMPRNFYRDSSNFMNGNYGIHFMNNSDNTYKVNKTLRSKSSHISTGTFNREESRNDRKKNDIAKSNATINTNQPIFTKNKKSSNLKKMKMCNNHHKKENNQNYTNNASGNDSDSYSKYKSDTSNNNSMFNNFCKKVNFQNIRSNNLASNYIDMNFDERLLPYYKENDSIAHVQSDEKIDINEYVNYSDDGVNSYKTEKKKRRKITGSDMSKGETVVQSDIGYKSYTSDGLVSLSSCNGITGSNNSGETYYSNLSSDIDTETETPMGTETPIGTETNVTNITNISNQKQMSLNNTKRRINCQDVYSCRFKKKRKQQSPNLPSNDLSCFSVCGSFNREEELKNLITEEGKEIEKERKIKGKSKKKEKNDSSKMIIKTIESIKSVKPVRETKRKKTIKGTKRIETTVPSKREEKEMKEKKIERKETVTIPIYCKDKEIINQKCNGQIINGNTNTNTQKNLFCYTSNEATTTFKASLETVVSTFIETKGETGEDLNFENVKKDKYELRAKKKITYVMPSIKRKLRRDSVRQIFDPFLYNTMWKIKN